MTGLSDDHDRLLARGRRLQLWTIAWNLMEVFVTIGLGIAAGSLALVAFGLDSIVEVFASVVVIWYIADHDGARRSVRALRLVAGSFLVLGVYLVGATTYSLVTESRAASSPFGIAYLAVTACVMFGLAYLKRITAKQSNSSPLLAEASMTFLDGCLATGILIALALNTAVGWWWADPGAALLIAAACFREARETWHASDDAD